MDQFDLKMEPWFQSKGNGIGVVVVEYSIMVENH